MLRQILAKKLFFTLGILGIVLIIIGSLWLTVIFPHYEKIPSSWKQTDELQGTFSYPDEAFLAELQGNATISQLLGPSGGGSLTGIKEIFSNQAILDLVSNPEIIQLLGKPGALELLADPKLANVLSQPDVVSIFNDPAVLEQLGNQASLAQLLSIPAFQALLSNPDVSALLQNPLSIDLLQSGLLPELIKNPDMLLVLEGGALSTILTSPAIQNLMSDPAAMGLILDSRTQKLLANPADLPMVTVPVLLHRERKVTHTTASKVYINEQVSTLDPATLQEVPGIDKTNVTLIVDRKSREYLPGTDGERSGLWGLPFNVKKHSYYAWVTAAERPLEAQYQGSEKIKGLNSYIHTVDVTNLAMPESDPASGLPLVCDALITTWSEPRTGSTIYAEDYDAVSAIDSSGNKYPRFVADLKQTDETTDNLVKKAKDNRATLLWFGDYIPWMILGLGIFLTVGACSIISVGIIKVRRAAGSKA